MNELNTFRIYNQHAWHENRICLKHFRLSACKFKVQDNVIISCFVHPFRWFFALLSEVCTERIDKKVLSILSLILVALYTLRVRVQHFQFVDYPFFICSEWNHWHTRTHTHTQKFHSIEWHQSVSSFCCAFSSHTGWNYPCCDKNKRKKAKSAKWKPYVNEEGVSAWNGFSRFLVFIDMNIQYASVVMMIRWVYLKSR